MQTFSYLDNALEVGQVACLIGFGQLPEVLDGDVSWITVLQVNEGKALQQAGLTCLHTDSGLWLETQALKGLSQ